MKSDSKEYWFKNKEYGLGWTPANFAGWAVFVSHIVAVVIVAMYSEHNGILESEPKKFFLLIGAVVFLLLAIVWKTGEPLKWRWGNKK